MSDSDSEATDFEKWSGGEDATDVELLQARWQEQDWRARSRLQTAWREEQAARE